MPKISKEEGGNITVRQFVCLKLIATGAGANKVTSGYVRQYLTGRNVEMGMTAVLTMLKNMERTGWIKGKIIDERESGGRLAEVNVWALTKTGREVFDRVKALMVGDKKQQKAE